MSIRGDHRSTRVVNFVSGERGWSAPHRAVLVHSSLPWCGGESANGTISALPLEAVLGSGEAERLSLLAQLAAHLEFLQFAGEPVGGWSIDEWSVTRSRQAGPRLIRTSAPLATEAESFPAHTILAEAAVSLSLRNLAPLEVSWARPGWLYRHIALELAERPATESLRNAAVGSVRAPGLQALRDWLTHPSSLLLIDDETDRLHLADALRGTIDLQVIGERASPIEPLSAFSGTLPRPRWSSEAEASDLAESLVRDGGVVAWVILNLDRFDSRSLVMAKLLADLDRTSRWITSPDVGFVSTGRETLIAARTRSFAIAPHMGDARALETSLAALDPHERRQWVESFPRSADWLPFMREGTLPDLARGATHDHLREPIRSFLAAVAVGGSVVPLRVAADVLEQLGAGVSTNDLHVEGLTTSDGDCLRFVSEAARRRLVSELTESSRAALALSAARALREQCADPLAAAAVLLEFRARDPLALAFLEEAAADAPEAAARLAVLQPPALLAPSSRLVELAGRALIQDCRYVDAVDRLAGYDTDNGRYLLALAQRRLGQYEKAAATLEHATGSDAKLLRAELLRLTRDCSGAKEILDSLSLDPHADRMRVEYESWLLDRESPTPELEAQPDSYWALRRDTYESIAESDFDAALASAQSAESCAPDAGLEIDASLDAVDCYFLRGEWERARHEARALLRLTEDTQGDRAASGALYILAWLTADSGNAREATLYLERLRSFLDADADELRLAELDLLSAAIALTEERWSDALAFAERTAAEVRFDDEIRGAAAWLAHEAQWASAGAARVDPAIALARGRELRDRAHLAQARCGSNVSPQRTFLADLARFDRGSSPLPPAPLTPSDRMLLRRSLARRSDDDPANAKAVGSRSSVPESELLRKLATAEFPFAPDIGVQIAVQNRFGRTSILGTDEQPSERAVEGIAALGNGWSVLEDRVWIRCTGFERDLLPAVAAIVSLRLDRWRRERIDSVEAVVAAPASSIQGLVGSSDALNQVRSIVARVAPRADIAVTIIGESGTGKELVAAALHRGSPRRQQPLIQINCAALPESLIESELFGHARGAFTGADRDRIGLIEAAEGGTLFLDEIGELPLPAQAKLLRFLQEKEFRRVGETTLRHADVRIVSATHRHLDAAVDEGKFRADLYYRIRGLEVVIPPLRERHGDILEIAGHLLTRLGSSAPGGPTKFSDEVEAILISWQWPGNVREMEQVIRSAHALAQCSPVILREHLPQAMRGADSTRTITGTYYEELTRFRRDMIERALDTAAGNQSQAARALGITRQALAYQIRELGIRVRKS